MMSRADLPPFDVYHGDGEPRPAITATLPDEPVLFAEQGAYLADRDLVEAVNVSLAVGQPLLVTGEPGCGKTRLAWSVAHELGLGEPLPFYTRSTSRAQDLLYTFDAVRRFYDIQTRDRRAEQPANYVRYGPLGQAIVQGQRRVVLIDEVDKAPRDFPNDLLNEIDRMSFEVSELEGDDRLFRSQVRPVVIITSNSERQLPLPFLRRCVFHHISFPSRDKLVRIIDQRLGSLEIDGGLINAAVDKFQLVRQVKGLTKPPATGELLCWLMALHLRGTTAAGLGEVPLARLPLWQTLLKDRDDHSRLCEASA